MLEHPAPADEAAPAMTKKRVLITLGGGGHLFQAKSLIRHLGDDFSFIYVTSANAKNADLSALPPGPLYVTPHSHTFSDRAAAKRLFAMAQAFVLAGITVIRHRPDAVIGIASSQSIPWLFWAKALGIKAIFIESITWVHALSRTGAFLKRYRLCDRFYVQWPDAADEQRGIAYRGNVL